MSDDHRPPLLVKFLDHHPSPYVLSDPTEFPLTIPPPRTFYDKHLDRNLFLKRVVRKPLQDFLSTTVELTLRAMLDRGSRLPESFPRLTQPKKDEFPTDAENVAWAYVSTISKYYCIAATTLLLYGPSPRVWSTKLAFSHTLQHEPSPDFRLHHCENYALQPFTLPVSTSLPPNMDADTAELLQLVARWHPALALWDFFSVSDQAEKLLKEMGSTSSIHFDHPVCGTTGHITPPAQTLPQFDAKTTPWGFPIHSEADGVPSPSDARQLRDATSSGNRPDTSTSTKVLQKTQGSRDFWPVVTIASAVPNRTLGDLFLLRAWGRSATHDTTFLVFDCGNHEMYGYRHRASQTLYLSDLVDKRTCEPGYGQIHSGLYLAIVQDVLDRTKQRRDIELKQSSHRKRKRKEAPNSTPNKRYMTRGAVRKAITDESERINNLEIIKEHAASRSLALLELRYDSYNSASPAAFVRSGSVKEPNYSGNKYLSIVLTSTIAAGATGIAHGAQLKILVDGQTRSADVVVKLAFKPKGIERMRHEYRVYQHLSSQGVTRGIPVVFGLFEDVESEAVALVMTHVGECLWTLRPVKEVMQVEVSEPVKELYIRVLEEIHKAGVRHRDLRPENLMLTPSNEVAIIDFDMAELNPSVKSRKYEMEHLVGLLNKDYWLPIDISSSEAHSEQDSSGTEVD